MIKKLLSHSAIYGLAPHISKIAGIFALPIITRDLTELDYGIWGVIMGYVGLLEALKMLGSGVVLSNVFYKNPNRFKLVWRQIYGFLYLWMIPYCLTLCLVLFYILPESVGENKCLLISLLIVPLVLFGPSTYFGVMYYQLKQKPVPIMIRSVIFGFLSIGLNVYLISVLKLGYMGWAWSVCIVGLLSSLSYFIPLNFKLGISPMINFKKTILTKTFKVGFPTIPHAYSGYLLNSSDKIVLDQLNISELSVGKYSLASQFGMYFQQFFGALTKAVTPMLLDSYKRGESDESKKLVYITFFLGLLATSIFCLWSREVFLVLIKNDSLAAMYPLAIIIVMGYNYRPMYAAAINQMFYSEETSKLWRVSFIAGISNVILNIICVPIFGYQAAAYTTFISLMYMGYAGHFVPGFSQYLFVKYRALESLLLICVCTIGVYFLVEFSFIFKVGVTMLVLVPVLVYILKNRLSFK